MRRASFRYQASALANNSNITLTAAIKCEDSDMDFEEKRTLLETWYNKHQLNLVQVMRKSEAFAKRDTLDQLAAKSFQSGSQNHLYTLLVSIDNKLIPCYIGKTNSPLKRWDSHLTKLEKGIHSYGAWRTLLFDQTSRACFDVFLVVIPEDQIIAPAIDGFPTTVESIEY